MRIAEYEMLALKHGIDLKASLILEIGVGQRPYLGITLYGLGYHCKGIDLGQPIFPPTLAKAWCLYCVNGLLRLIKTLVRYFLFDRPEYSSLFRHLGLSNGDVSKAKIFVQGDAALADFESLVLSPATLESQQAPIVVASESVFEHRPRSDLSRILLNLRMLSEASKRQLLVLAMPTIFTGICGCRLAEWYHHNVYSSKLKKTESWGYLRKKRFAADACLNCQSRAECRELFEDSGDNITGEIVEHAGLGGEFLGDPALRAGLSDWSDEELFSNEVMFELVLSSEADGGSK